MFVEGLFFLRRLVSIISFMLQKSDTSWLEAESKSRLVRRDLPFWNGHSFIISNNSSPSMQAQWLFLDHSGEIRGY